MHSLEGKTVSLLETQKQVIKEILDEKRKSGEIKSDYEYKQQEQTMLEKVSSTPAPFLKVREQRGISDASLYNASFEELTYDLATVFSQVNQIEETINKHQRLNQSLLMSLQLRIKKIEEDLAKHERISNLYDSHQIYIESFIDPNGVELKESFYTERDGVVLPNYFHAQLDTSREAIKLPTIVSENSLIGPSGVQLGKLVITKQLGSGYNLYQNPANGLAQAIDNSNETFWAETLLVDSPIHVSLGKNYYDLDFGAVCEVEVQFDYLTQLNELGFYIFGEYPLDIVSVRYYETDNVDELPQELINPTQPIEALRSRTVSETTSYQFPDIYAKRLRILFNQRHYIKNDFMASRRNQENLQVLFNAANNYYNPEIVTEDIYAPVILDRQEKDKSWGLFRKTIANRTLDLKTILDEVNQDVIKAISKYEYTYGLYNLDIRRNEYQPTGIHVSAEIPVMGNVKTVKIESTEEHPEPIPGTRLTDIEYYVYSGKAWHPIMPVNVESIQSERLFPTLVSGQYKAALRFPVKDITTLVVRENGLAITNWTAVDGLITLSSYDASAIYTASYMPSDSARELNFLDILSPKTLVEEFRGTNSKGIVHLNYYPFVDKALLNAQGPTYDPTYLENEINSYLPIKVKLIDKDGYHIMQPTNATEVGIRVENVTDYFNPEVSHLQNYDEANDIWYQYRVVDNTIQFNKAIPDDTRIIIEYPHLVGHIRVKSILRRNIHGFHGLSPMLHQYITHFETLR